jgi:osmotically-inducible protein OsmY
MSRLSFLPLTALLLLAACAATPTDEKLEEAVRLSIHQHPALLGDRLTIHIEDGVVYISGLVPTYSEQKEVEEVVKATPGVKRVVNNTAIEGNRN